VHATNSFNHWVLILVIAGLERCPSTFKETYLFYGFLESGWAPFKEKTNKYLDLEL
jgi:hypothetical protein